jgi:hypothetical protein
LTVLIRVASNSPPFFYGHRIIAAYISKLWKKQH